MNIMELAIMISWIVVALYAGLILYLETHRDSGMYQYFPRVRKKATMFCRSLITDLFLSGFLIYYNFMWIITSMALIDACIAIYGLYLVVHILWCNR